jgi:hypothetical protein
MMKIIVFQLALHLYLTREIHFTHTCNVAFYRANAVAEKHGRKYAGENE